MGSLARDAKDSSRSLGMTTGSMTTGSWRRRSCAGLGASSRCTVHGSGWASNPTPRSPN